MRGILQDAVDDDDDGVDDGEGESERGTAERGGRLWAYTHSQVSPLRRPTSRLESCWKAEGEKSRSQMAQPVQRSTA